MAPTPANRTPDLHGVIGKYDRAREHLKALDASVADFVDAQEDLIFEEFDLVEQWYIARLSYPPELSRRWSLLLGDTIQNLRAALDHLVYQLVILSGNNPTKFSGTQWPIVSNEDEYWNGRVQNCPVCRAEWRGKPLRDTNLNGVDDKYRRLIDDLQPCNGDAGRLLLPLNALSNHDKHRLLNANVLIPHQGAVRIPHPRRVVKWPDELPAIYDRVEMYRWKVDVPEWPRLEIQAQPYITFLITFGKTGVTMPNLATLADGIAAVISVFSGFFPAGSFPSPSKG